MYRQMAENGFRLYRKMIRDWYTSLVSWTTYKFEEWFWQGVADCSKPKVFKVKSADVCKVDDKVYKVSATNNCLCHECTSGFTTFKTRMKFKSIKGK